MSRGILEQVSWGPHLQLTIAGLIKECADYSAHKHLFQHGTCWVTDGKPWQQVRK